MKNLLVVMNSSCLFFHDTMKHILPLRKFSSGNEISHIFGCIHMDLKHEHVEFICNTMFQKRCETLLIYFVVQLDITSIQISCCVNKYMFIGAYLNNTSYTKIHS